MATVVRSFSKINLGLAIGAPRPDGFHSLTTLYQTIALHDLLTISARPATRTKIQLTSNDIRVPRDARNTAWKMVSRILEHLGIEALVNIRIQKNLPIQGGMGAGSANAAAALLGLERELSLTLPEAARLGLAAEVGSDVPLFLLGGTVLGTDRGQVVSPCPDITLAGATQIPCVVALPKLGVSTPQAFRDWDARCKEQMEAGLPSEEKCDTVKKLSRTLASAFPHHRNLLLPVAGGGHGFAETGASDKNLELIPGVLAQQAATPERPENLQGLSREQPHARREDKSGSTVSPEGNSLLALLESGIENDFESVVFLQNPALAEIKRDLMGAESEGSAVYAALSGSGSALFGLYRSGSDAARAQQRLQQHGVQAILTETMPRPLFWSNMFAE